MEVSLSQLLGINVEKAIPRDAAYRFISKASEVLKSYQELSRDDRVRIGTYVSLLYPDLSLAPKELQRLEYVGAHTANLLVRDGNYGCWALYRSKNPTVTGGFFGYGALGMSENAKILGGTFTFQPLWLAKDPVIIGGQLGYESFTGAEGIRCYVKTIRSVSEPTSGVIIAEEIGEVRIHPNCLNRVKVFCAKVGKGSELCTLVKKEDLARSVTLENLDQAIKAIEEKARSEV